MSEKQLSTEQLHYPQEEDEISLVDLFVVLLRYRRLIIGATLAAVVLAVLGYLFYTRSQYNQALEEKKSEVVMSLSYSPVVGMFEYEAPIENIVLKAPVLLDALQKAGYTYFPPGRLPENGAVDLTREENRSQALYMIRRRLIENKTTGGGTIKEEDRFLLINEDAQGKDTFSLLCRSSDEAKARAFLDALAAVANRNIIDYLEPRAELAVSSYEQLLRIENPNEGVQNAIDSGKERYDAAKQIVQGGARALVQSEDIYVVEQSITLAEFRSEFKVKAVVLVIAVLFLSVFLAFLLNAVANVKKDEESMEKIRQALGKDKR